MIHALALTGPTASGKTAISLAIAKEIGAEIICLDSMQIYRDMNIGTAKATSEEQAVVTHHMLDVCAPDEPYSVMQYRKDALSCLNDISARGKTALFVGGTGLYADSLTRSEPDSPEQSEQIKKKVVETYGEDPDSLWQALFEIDPESAEKIHKNNKRRVMRALEIYLSSGITKTEYDIRSKEKPSEVALTMITLDFHIRELLYQRIDKRVDKMISDGLVSEVSSLYGRGLLSSDTTAAQAIGYKEIIAYLRGEKTLEEAIEEIKLSSRRYAKRQLTWFRHNKDAYRLYVDTENGEIRPTDELIEEALSVIRESGFNG